MLRRRIAAWTALLPLLTACAAASDPDAAASDPDASASDPTPASPTEPTEAAGPAPEPAGPSCADPPCYGEPEVVGRLAPDLIEGVSGMSASHRWPGWYYVVSDHAGTSEVLAVEEDGALVARVEIEGMSARNAEALAVGPCGDGGPDACLFVGDIGDHVGRDDVVVYRLPEPDLEDPPPGPVAADALRFTYPDSPTDAEALLVDAAGRLLIISKAAFDSDTGETGPTRLYRGSTDGGTMEYLGEIDLPEPEAPVFAALAGNVVTGADAHEGAVLLRTYDDVLEYRADGPDADLAGFPDWPMRPVPSPFQIQSETVAYRIDGCGYLTTAEIGGSIAAVDCLEH